MEKHPHEELTEETVEPTTKSEGSLTRPWSAADYQSADFLQLSGDTSGRPGQRHPAAAQAEALRDANERTVQSKGNQAQSDVQQTARKGVAGPGQELPHLTTIQRAFGRHDVGDVQAHVGGPAAKASDAIGAQAYATGNDVAFRAQPDLHTAAHEAAHVVQQRGGVQLKGGVGQTGDAYEQHADQVADTVVRGESAEALLDRHAASSGGAPATQMKADGQTASGETTGASNPHSATVLKMGDRGEAVAYLQTKLVEAGADIEPDGAFGPATRAAVVAYQRAAGLGADGVVGSQTWGALDGGNTPNLKKDAPPAEETPAKEAKDEPPATPETEEKDEAPPAKEEAPPAPFEPRQPRHQHHAPPGGGP